MEAFAFYLLKSAAWLSGFAIIYLIFLRKERFFMLKRIYLILGIVVSFIFPLITIHYQVEIPSPPVIVEELLPSAYSQNLPAHAATAATPGFNFWLLAGVVYLSGILIFIARSIWQISNLFWSIKRAKADNLGPVRVIRASEYLSSFSFFNYVFVNPSVSGNEIEEIMNHELVHVNQKHWFDLVLGELLRLFQWANPFAWIYTGFIRLNHEYLADEEALQRTTDPAVYKATLINQIFGSPVINLTNSFNYSITKTRFDMMKKIIISPYRKLRILLVLPVFAIVFYAFATPEYHYITLPEETMTILSSEPILSSESILASEPILTSEPIQASEPIQNSVKGKVLKEDGSALPGVAVVVSGTSQGAISDINGNFALADVTKDAIFIFSLKGYITQAIELKRGKDIEVRMKKDPAYKDEIVVVGYGNSPGKSGSINFRNSYNGISDSVVVVIDGIRTDRKGLKEINPNSIESISVLKDASARKVYGADGNNGVIIITTKKNQVVRGVVVDEQGKPLQNVNITTTGTLGSARGVSTDENGRFFLSSIQSDASLLFSLRGYKGLSLKADFSQEMKVTMVGDPEYKEPDYSKTETKPGDQPIPITVLDGVIAKEPASVIISKLGGELGLVRNLPPKVAIEKYGEAGKNGATEIYTRKKAAELGIKVPFRREGPDDFPTFQGANHMNFASWIAEQVKYPAEASSQGIKGRVSVGFKIEPDGSLTEIKPMGTSDPILTSAVVKAIQSAPKWDRPKNPEVTDPYSSFVNLKFELPDKVTVDNTYVVVEQMPQFPGGDVALLNYIKDNVKYPEGLKSEKISGRVIVRFIVNSEGKTEEVLILKSVHPLLDAEALRVVSSLTDWQPGMQGGKAVNVWYMVPVNFIIN